MSGKLIAIEGIDASGKETQSKLLMQKLKKTGQKTVLFSFPRSETKIGQEIKKRLKTSLKPNVADLFTQDFLNARPEIENYLKQNYFVICDRYTPSNWAYQEVKIKGMPKADLIIFLDLPPLFTQQLISTRKEKDNYEKNLPFLEKVYKRYQQLTKQKNWISIQCYRNKKILSKEKISKIIWQQIKKRFCATL